MIIGITGKSGSGKSYLAKEIAKSSDKFVYVDMDFIMRNPFSNSSKFDVKLLLKKSKLRNLIILGHSKMNTIFLKNRKIYDVFLKFITIKVNKIINENKNNIILIDSYFLPVMNELNKNCEIKVFVDAEQNTRLKRALGRNFEDKNAFIRREINNKYVNFEKEKFDIVFDSTNANEEKTQEIIKKINELILIKQNKPHTCNCKETCKVCHCKEIEKEIK